MKVGVLNRLAGRLASTPSQNNANLSPSPTPSYSKGTSNQKAQKNDQIGAPLPGIPEAYCIRPFGCPNKVYECKASTSPRYVGEGVST